MDEMDEYGTKEIIRAIRPIRKIRVPEVARRMHIDCGFAEVNDTRLYYECAGVGEALVLVHGFTLDNRMWDGQFEAFARHFRVVRYDLRGFGKSAVPDETAYVHADDLAALLTHLESVLKVISRPV